jgi:WD40 repeat protein
VFTRRTTPAVRTAYSPDGRFALGVHDNHKMTLMDSVSGDEWHTVEANQNAIKAVALSPDRRIAVTASEKTISVWKLWDTEIAPAPK